jgi:hypothetical protein
MEPIPRSATCPHPHTLAVPLLTQISQRQNYLKCSDPKLSITTNNLMETTTSASPFAPIVSAEPETIARLPFYLLSAATKFAANDPTKPAINRVNVAQRGELIRIAATNGHIACRFYVSTTGEQASWLDSEWPEFNIKTTALLKRCAYGRDCLINRSGEVRIFGGKKSASDFIESRNGGDLLDPHTFPNIDAVWPESFHNEPKGVICWDPGYMAMISDAVQTIGGKDARVKFSSNGPTTPLGLELHNPPEGILRVEFLLMPIQIRA